MRPATLSRDVEAQLNLIRTRLLNSAEDDLALAEKWRVSRKQGERNGVGIVARRGIDAINAVALLDAVVIPAEQARRAYPEATPRRGMSL